MKYMQLVVGLIDPLREPNAWSITSFCNTYSLVVQEAWGPYTNFMEHLA